jgi:dihydroxyacetone kinase
MELAIVARHALAFLANRELTVERIYAGTFLSSLDMAGISISLLGLTDERLRWLDAATTAPAWPNVLNQPPGKPNNQIAAEVIANEPSKRGARTEAGKKTQRAIEAACHALIAAEPELTELDRITGDGDLGASMTRAAKAIEAEVAGYPLDDIPATLKALSHTLRNELGGSSGPLYGVGFLRCATALATQADWPAALDQGCKAISELGGAKPGDRTMLDALDPFVKTLKQGTIKDALEAAERGVEATAHMKPKLGRSSYLGDRVLGHPDPGAKAVSIWLRAACREAGIA